MTAPMVCVPVEPTDDMIDAGLDARDDRKTIGEIYAAMIAAAPAPQPVQGEAVAWLITLRDGFRMMTTEPKDVSAWQGDEGITVTPLFTQPPAPAVTQTVAAPGDVERDAFEAWAGPQGLRLVRRDMAGSTRFGQYCDDGTQLAFEAYRAALRSQGQAEAVVPPCPHLTKASCDCASPPSGGAR